MLLHGIIPPITYTRGQGNDKASSCVVAMTVKDGQPSAVKGPETFTCAPQ